MTTYNWKELKIGGGGQLIYVGQSLDAATTIINTDTAGPFILNLSTGLWVGLVGQDTVPSAWCLPTTPAANLGIICYACVVAPSNKDIGYMILSHSDGSAAGFFACTNLTAAAPTWTECINYIGKAFEPSNNENTQYGSNGPMMGPRMAVDPNNSAVCYVGTSRNTQQPQVTLDGGATFHTLSGIPSPTTDQFGNAAGWCIDGSGGTTSSSIFGQSVLRSSIVWAGSYGNNIYRSIAGDLTTWTAITGGSGGVTTGKYYWMSIDSNDGQVYVTTDAPATGSGTAGFYTIARGSTSWSALITDSLVSNMVRVVPDPFIAGRIACVNSSGNIRWNTAHGSGSFTGTGTVVLNTPSDVPWLAGVNTHGSVGAGVGSLGVGGAVYDNAIQNKMWACDGIGLWYTTSSSGDAAYTSKTAGISQLVTNRIKSPWISKSPTLIASWDRAIFATTNPEIYPSGYGPNYTNTPFGIEMGWDVDWSFVSPNVIVLLNQWQNENSSISIDGGITWSLLANAPPTPGFAGCVAISDANHIICAQSNRGDLIYTNDQAATAWTKVDMSAFGNTPAGTTTLTIAGTANNAGHVKCTSSTPITGIIKVGDNPTAKTGLADITGLGTNNYVLSIDDATHFTVDSTFVGPSQSGTLDILSITGNTNAYFTGCFRVCADRVALNQFYYFNNNAAAQGGGFYKITFPGGTFTMVRQRTTPPDGVSWGNYSEIKVAPYNGSTRTSGHVIWSAGYASGTNLYFSHDEGVTWDIVGTGTNAVGQTFGVGWGATKPGNDYPSCYFYGYVNGVLAIWQIDATAAQWTAGTGGGSINIGTPVNIGNLSDLPRKFQTDWCGTVEGDANIYGQIYVGFKGAASAYRQASIDLTSGGTSGFSVIHGHAKGHTKMIGY